MSYTTRRFLEDSKREMIRNYDRIVTNNYLQINQHKKIHFRKMVNWGARGDVLVAVAQDGDDLFYASAELQADQEVVLAAVAQTGYALAYASAELQADLEVVLEAVAREGRALALSSAELQDHREVVLTAVYNNGHALRYASEDLKADWEIVLAAVAEDGCALRHASDELKADQEMVLAAMVQNGGALLFASEELRIIGRAALLADAAKLRAGGRLVAALQWLAFTACFADAGQFVPATSHESALQYDTVCLDNVPTDVFELIQQSLVQALPELELISRTSEQGWAWRSTTGLGLPARVEVEGMVTALKVEIVG